MWDTREEFDAWVMSFNTVADKVDNLMNMWDHMKDFSRESFDWQWEWLRKLDPKGAVLAGFPAGWAWGR